jgi:hypothetical protein
VWKIVQTIVFPSGGGRGILRQFLGISCVAATEGIFLKIRTEMMTLRLGKNDLQWHAGWHFNLRDCDRDQRPTTLDVFRGATYRTFSVRDGGIYDGDRRICDATITKDGCVIGMPDSLMTPDGSTPAPPHTEAQAEKPPPETVPETRLLVA